MQSVVKIVILWVVFQAGAATILAETRPVKGRPAAEGSAMLLLLNHHPKKYRDSVYITYDRYDLSGAGVVKQFYYPKKNHTIDIQGIPAGKYFVTIQFFGTHHG